jgi:cyclopropane fatty-acyl-phospholipid synthase-like methyltransferase
MSVEERVAHHFENDALRFDAIYRESGKNWFSRFVDNRWRGVVQRRLELAVAELSPLEGKSILDVGCGSGRYCHAFAAGGARRVLGIDFAPAMIDIADRLAAERGLADRCRFRVATFPTELGDERFDASTAMGYFDYVETPEDHLRAMRVHTTGVLLMSFPKAWEWRVPVRRVRFAIRRVPLFLYSERGVRDLLARAGIDDYRFIDLKRDYVVVARP